MGFEASKITGINNAVVKPNIVQKQVGKLKDALARNFGLKDDDNMALGTSMMIKLAKVTNVDFEKGNEINKNFGHGPKLTDTIC